MSRKWASNMDKTYVGIDPWLVGKDMLIVISIRPTATVKDFPNQHVQELSSKSACLHRPN